MTSLVNEEALRGTQHRFPDHPIDPRWMTLYLLIPAVIFLLGFITPIAGITIVCLLTTAWASVAFMPSQRSYVSKSWLAPITFAVLMLLFIGFPSGPYVYDWIKHWAIINELAANPWPVNIDLFGNTEYLRYYIAAYLPSAFIHKILPTIDISALFAAWLFIGFLLMFQSVATLVSGKAKVWLILGMFLSLGGADMFAEHAIRALNQLPATSWFNQHYDVWQSNSYSIPKVEFSSIMTLLLWVPNQSLATFIVVGLLILQRSTHTLDCAVLSYGLLALWSPYGMIGLLPIMLAVAWQYRQKFTTIKTLLCSSAGATFAIVVGVYLSADLAGAGPCLDCLPKRLVLIPNYITFWEVELICFALILRNRLFQDTYCLISLITLIIISLLQGDKPDFAMRASMGPLFVLSLRSVETIMEWHGSKTRKYLYILAICICLPSAVSEVRYRQDGGSAYAALTYPDPLSASWLRSMFASRDNYTAEEFLTLCSPMYLQQYFTSKKPYLLK